MIWCCSVGPNPKTTYSACDCNRPLSSAWHCSLTPMERCREAKISTKDIVPLFFFLCSMGEESQDGASLHQVSSPSDTQYPPVWYGRLSNTIKRQRIYSTLKGSGIHQKPNRAQWQLKAWHVSPRHIQQDAFSLKFLKIKVIYLEDCTDHIECKMCNSLQWVGGSL